MLEKEIAEAEAAIQKQLGYVKTGAFGNFDFNELHTLYKVKEAYENARRACGKPGKADAGDKGEPAEKAWNLGEFRTEEDVALLNELNEYLDEKFFSQDDYSYSEDAASSTYTLTENGSRDGFEYFRIIISEWADSIGQTSAYNDSERSVTIYFLGDGKRMGDDDAGTKAAKKDARKAAMKAAKEARKHHRLERPCKKGKGGITDVSEIKPLENDGDFAKKPEPAQAGQPAKRKRGRPRKNPLPPDSGKAC